MPSLASERTVRPREVLGRDMMRDSGLMVPIGVFSRIRSVPKRLPVILLNWPLHDPPEADKVTK